ncbi:B3 domain-containing protein-like protein [Salvia divinorum]|uniref:B3 domain-containing protein-like protein n=1 Tax=Salvia divinorum TaxID=28513 RepID=A0ABD1H1F1_SALDI
MGGGSYYDEDSDDSPQDLRKAPSFMKVFYVQQNMESICIPSEWVCNHGNDVPSHCSLSMPNGIPWSVHMLKSWERDDELVPDVETSKDYSTFEVETPEEFDEDYDTENGPNNLGDYPSFRIVLTKSHIKRTLVSICLPQ